MSVAILPMSVDLGWSDTTKGAVSSLFSVGYGLCIVPAGLMVSWQSPTRVLAVGVGVWSMATMLTPHAAVLPGMMALLLVRAAVGAGESVIMPSLQTLLLNWTSPQEKSRALAWIYSGFHVGTISAYVTSPIIMSEVGWTGLFEVYGAAGLLILIPWLMYARDGPAFVGPPANSVTNIKVNNVPQQQMQQSIAALQEAPWRDFLQSKGAWAMLLAHCAKNWGLYTSLAWTPTFFAEQYHLDAKESALFSVLPSVVGAIGGIVAGTLVDSLISEDDGVGSRTRLRKIFQCIAFLGPALALGTLALSIPEEPWLAQVFLVISIGLQSFNTAGFEAGTQEKAGQRWAGLLYSWTSLPAVVVGTSGVYVAGRILDATGQDWSMVFGLNAIVNVIGALAFVSLYDAKREFD
jgi:ACS family sodium-dependent inorganic phosphate cotransporter